MKLSQTEYVVLVDQDGNPIGKEEKMAAHQKGLLHKAFSVSLFNSKGQILLQQRAFHKYHTPGLWSNSCCSHPRVEENIELAVHRRLKEELGISDIVVEEQFSFVYRFLDEPTQLWEHEHDTVFTGHYDGEIPFNKEEVNAIKWIDVKDLEEWINREPEAFTFWFKEFLPKMIS